MIIVLNKKKIGIISVLFLIVFFVFSVGYNVSNMVNSNLIHNKNNILVIDPGHGGEDPGAVSDYNKISEKDINLKIALKLKELLIQEGFSVIMTRETDELKYQDGTKNIISKRKQDLKNRKKIIDESMALAAISIHLNKYPENKYKGARVFFPHDSPQSRQLATYVQKSLKENVDQNNNREALLRGKPEDIPIILFRNIKVPTVIAECGFLSNEEEEILLADDKYQESISNAVKQGIMGYVENNNAKV